MTNLKLKRRIIALITASSFVIVPSLFMKRDYNPKITYLHNSSELDPYARYSNGDVYIIHENNEPTVKENINKNDIIVIDERTCDDPNLRIEESEEVRNREDMREILIILDEYEKENPTDWCRSIDSMQNEWVVHNFFATYDLFLDHTEDVDLNNNDENKYKSKILSRILRN